MNYADSLLPYLPYAALAVNAIVLIAACLAILDFRRRIRCLDALQQPTADPAMPDDGARERDRFLATSDINHALRRLQDEVRELRDSSRSGDSPGASQLPIDFAIRMARSGASIDELARTCGLSTGEAQLTHKLHGEAARARRAQ